MSTPPNPTQVTTQVHINKVNQSSGQVESGWEVTVRDGVTGTSVPVFIPDNVYGTENAKVLITFELEKVRGVHALDL